MALPVRGTALSVLALALWATGAAAQISPTLSPRVRTPVLPTVRPAVPDAGELALEGPVDASTYRLGPGDVFVVSIGPRQTTTVVTADGLLVVPEAGTFEAAGRTLAEVRSRARAALDRLYRNVSTDIALASPRRFSVHVSGAVPFPGRHALSAVGRVEDALAQATAPAAPRALADYASTPRVEVERRPALRNVVVTGRDGGETRVDLMRYFATGDVAYNPTLDDGDALYLSTFDPTREGVSVSGAVDRPGFYDWRPGDTAAALVEVAAGTGLERRVTTVRRTRTASGRSESVEVPLAEAASLAIEPRDQIFVVASGAGQGFARVVGAVAFPGAYPIQSGATTLRDLVEAAGGLTSDALVRGTYLERSARAEPQVTLNPLALPSDRSASPSAVDSSLTDLGRRSGLGLVGRQFYAQEYVSTPRLSLDVAAALAGGEAVMLREGDRLVVPRDLGLVRVFGQVGEPGYQRYQEGSTAQDYVTRAGGPGPSATAVYTVDARTGRFVEGPDTTVRPGDAVFMDRTPTGDQASSEQLAFQQRQAELQERQADRDDRRDARQARYQFIQTVLTVAGTVLTAIIAVAALNDSNTPN